MQAFLGLYIHIVFSTKGRKLYMQGDNQQRMWSYLGGIARKLKMKTITVGGHEDHVHLLVSLPSDLSIAKTVNLLKSNSSHWFRKEVREFAWQKGYGAFSVSASSLESVVHYIKNQEEHHKKRSFEQEFMILLKKYGVEHDPRYVFD